MTKVVFFSNNNMKSFRFAPYFELKFLLVSYMVFSPICETIYDSLIATLLSSQGLEDEIDNNVSALQNQMYNIMVTMLDYGKSYAMIIIFKLADQVKTASSSAIVPPNTTQ
jgi:hypothetical protein